MTSTGGSGGAKNPLHWFKERAFWREVTVSVVASLILTVLVRLWGEFSGYMQQPEVGTFMQGFFPWVLMFGLFNAALLTLSAGIRLLRRKPRDGMGAFVQFGYTFVCLLLAAFWVAYIFTGWSPFNPSN